MKYENIKEGVFIARPNRFIALVNVDGKEEVCHVKNTGRCKELLVPGAKVYLQQSNNPERKTKFDLISVYKGEMLVNIDSQAPNKVFGEWIANSEYFGKTSLIKAETKYKNSRFDFYIESDGRRIFVEIKGVALEENGVVKFPDAPTERGVKHIRELVECIKEGYEGYIFFVVQMDKDVYFTPNRETHKEFADALVMAEKMGVEIRCVNCNVTKDILHIKNLVDVRL